MYWNDGEARFIGAQGRSTLTRALLESINHNDPMIALIPGADFRSWPAFPIAENLARGGYVR